MNDIPLWVLAVIGDPDGETAVLAIQPRDAATHEQAALRLRRAGYARPGRHEWQHRAWQVSPTSAVDVVAGRVVRMTTGTASMYVDGDVEVTDTWVAAAKQRRALVALIPPGTFTGEEVDPDNYRRLDDVAAKRGLLAALAVVRFDLFTGGRPRR